MHLFGSLNNNRGAHSLSSAFQLIALAHQQH